MRKKAVAQVNFNDLPHYYVYYTISNTFMVALNFNMIFKSKNKIFPSTLIRVACFFVAFSKKKNVFTYYHVFGLLPRHLQFRMYQ